MAVEGLIEHKCGWAELLKNAQMKLTAVLEEPTWTTIQSADSVEHSASMQGVG